jgi:phosphotransferase system enzyme I (PtsI)
MQSERRKVLRGIAASPGVAVGRVRLLDIGRVYVSRRYVARDQIEAEERRLRDAIESSRRELESVRSRLQGNEQRLLLDAQLLMHRDELLIDGAVETLRERSLNAEWALAQTIAKLAEQMRAASEPYFRDRAGDIENVGERILRTLTGAVSELPQVERDSVIVADDLGPADAAQVLRSNPCGIVIDLGSASSHTAILARALEIPCVVGVRGVSQALADDEMIIIDGFRGEVVLFPEPEECAVARERAERFRAFTRSLRAHGDRVTATRDGRAIALDANVELPAEAALAIQESASGIGLYRTEFLFLDPQSPPSELEQLKIYADVVQVMAPRPVVFRTFDIGGDKLHAHAQSGEQLNPALGLRGLRFGLANPLLLKSQLRALLATAVHGDVRVMFPLVTGIEELRLAKALLLEAHSELIAEGRPSKLPRVGVMIETPAAVMTADVLAKEVDFFSVGTNDLVQYTLVVDRGNPRVAHMASVLHPAVLRMLDRTAFAARHAGIELSMCGGMASDPIALPLVLGLGFERLSVDLAYLPFVRALIGAIDLADARAVAIEALSCDATTEVAALVVARFRAQLGELWSEQGIDV